MHHSLILLDTEFLPSLCALVVVEAESAQQSAGLDSTAVVTAQNRTKMLAVTDVKVRHVFAGTKLY